MPAILHRVSLSVAPLLSASAVEAATITHAELYPSKEAIFVDGTIVSGDLEKFRSISARYQNAIVYLSSKGGAVWPAIEIGKIIRKRGFETLVEDNATCTSACALIWIAGKTRKIAKTGRIGFHAAYLSNKGKPVESGVANALVGNYLTLLGLPQKAIIFATIASPSQILWLTEGNKMQAGIDFTPVIMSRGERIEGFEPAPTSEQAPPVAPVAPLPIASQASQRGASLPAPFPPRLSQTGENWIKFAGNAYYDQRSLITTLDGDSNISSLTMWVAIDFTDQTNKNERFDEYRNNGKKIKRNFIVDYQISKFTVNCTNETYSYENVRRFHDENEIQSTHSEKSSIIYPGTAEKSIYNKLCER